jgi:DNA polymerase-3 subunit delta
MTPQQFASQLKSPGAAPAYLFLGAENYRRRGCRKMLIEHFLPEPLREDGLVRHDLEELDLRAVLDDAGALSLFLPRRVIWADSAEAALPRTPSSEAEAMAAGMLDAYLTNPPADVVLVFDAQRYGFDGDDKSKIERVRKFYARIPNVVEFHPYTEPEARKLATELAARQQLKIAPAEIASLVEAVGNDAARIAVEIEKLALFTACARPVSENDILALAPDARSTTIFALVGSLARGEREKSLDYLATLVREGEYLPLALLFLATQFRFALAAREEGLRSPQQIQTHFARLGVPMWPSRAQQVLQTVNAFSKEKLELALMELFRTDKAFRDRNPDDRLVMENLILALTR